MTLCLIQFAKTQKTSVWDESKEDKGGKGEGVDGQGKAKGIAPGSDFEDSYLALSPGGESKMNKVKYQIKTCCIFGAVQSSSFF
jgi:hypothetical protein